MSARKSRQARKWRDNRVYFRLLKKEISSYDRKRNGWLHLWDEEDRVTYPIHWLDHRTVLIHKGRKPR